MLTAERLRAVIKYDSVTGIFIWLAHSRPENVGAIAGRIFHPGYRRIYVDGRHYFAHRLAWLYVYGEWPKLIDHKDACGDHNWISNLREATHSQNLANSARRSDNRSGFRGVSFRIDKGKWTARVRFHGKVTRLGYFASPEAAHQAYVEASKKIHGEFARAG